MSDFRGRLKAFLTKMNAFLWKAGKIKYIIAALTGLALIGLVLVLAIGKGGDGAETIESSSKAAVTKYGSTGEASEAEKTTAVSKTKKEETAKSSTAAGLIRVGGGRTVLESVYQDTPGYDWTNLYVILTDVSRTSPYIAETGAEPFFFLFADPNSDTPLLLTGLIGETKETTQLLLYVMEGERLYQLGGFNEAPYYSPADHALVFKDEMAMYTYTPHVLIRDELTELPDELRNVAMVSLKDMYITSENVETFLVRPDGEEDTK